MADTEIAVGIAWTVEAVVTRADGTTENLGELGREFVPLFEAEKEED